MMARRANGSNTWHTCNNCSQWPSEGHFVEGDTAAGGDQCDECLHEVESETASRACEPCC